MVKRFSAFVRKLSVDTRGLTTVEYAIVLCLIAAMSVTLWKNFGTTFAGKVSEGTLKVNNNILTEEP